MTFTHNHKDDTIMERDGDTIQFSFYGNMFLLEEHDHMDFKCTQEELFQMLSDYFDAGQHADLFDQLTLPGQDALWNALLWLRDRKVTL